MSPLLCQLSYLSIALPKPGGGGETRTRDTRIMIPMLFQLSYATVCTAKNKLVEAEGFEPSKSSPYESDALILLATPLRICL